MVDVLLGAFFGDCGKGKIIDYFTDDYDIVARFSGGDNCGHTVIFGDKKFVLHNIPSGIFKGKINVIGNGCVINPIALKKEIEGLKDYIDLDKLYISNKAHLILPTHILKDIENEEKKGNSKIGSTLKGIGPAYTDKISREGIRVGDILLNKLTRDEWWKLFMEKRFGHKDLQEINKVTDEFYEAIEFLKTLKIVDTAQFLNWELKNGSRVLAEGAQGALLDIDFGSYPYVTSCNTTIGGVITGLGIPTKYIQKVYGVVKSYSTRVGNGPYPTELFDEVGEKLRKLGHEFGSTTGRSRRCGWLDLVALKYSIMINGITDLIITKIDILNDFQTIKVCTDYNVNGHITSEMPYDLETAKPIYKEYDGWMCDVNLPTTPKDIHFKGGAELPTNLRYFIDDISNILDTNVSHISISADREGIIRL